MNDSAFMYSVKNIIEIIQLMLAPGLMISACGLLLLGMNNKYSLIVNRIRLLNQERRSMAKNCDAEDFSYQENLRLESISKQLVQLVFRVKLVKNAVFAYTVSVGLFIVTSLLIGIEYFSKDEILNNLITIVFLLGMVSLLIGIVFAAYETIKGYEIVRFEVASDE